MSSSLALGGNILIYAFSFWLTQPVLPFLLKELSADSLLFSRFQTFCSFLQLLGGPLAGRFQRSCAKSSALVRPLSGFCDPEVVLGPKDIGLVMSVGGVVSIVANGVLLQFFLSRWSERSVIFGSSVVIALSFVLYAHLPIGEGALAVLMALTVPLMGASAIAYTVLSSQMSKGAKNEDRATAIGLSHASRSACGLVAPTLGAIVLQDYGFQALGYTCAIATVISIAYAALNHAPAPSHTNKKLN
ncbi:hypothetical protein AeMF1_012601 [Aphanomyces euteiches]|nr:hypothetical protein AeMF1_012601 [Aphanomyces euteiches]KAH9187106.1 hypothetical protein AeNC1_010917 [Aphanomyces euteiches]